METETQHRELAEALRSTAAAVALSGYHSPLYDDLYSDWCVTEIAASTQQSGAHAARTEVVWTNYEPIPSLLTEATA